MNVFLTPNLGLLWQIISELAAIHSNGVQDCGIQADLTRLGPVASLGKHSLHVNFYFFPPFLHI